MYTLPVLVAFAWSKRPIRYAVALGGILLVGTGHGGLSGTTVSKERDFFGVLKVRLDPKGQYLNLVSGSTLHGAQTTNPKSKGLPLTYYHPTGPVGDVLGPLPDRSLPTTPAAEPARRVGRTSRASSTTRLARRA